MPLLKLIQPTILEDYGKPIQAALDEVAAAGGGEVVLAPGRYPFTGPLKVGSNTVLRGSGGTVLVARVPERAAVRVEGRQVTLAGFAIDGAAGTRTGYTDASGVAVVDAEGVRLDGLDISRTSAAGIIVLNSSRVQITACTVRNSLADGYHISARSRFVQITGCASRDNGDDLFACVGYGKNGGRVENVVISGCQGSNGKGRGIACLGTRNLVVSGNLIEGTDAAGLYLHQEDNYETYGSAAITVTGNLFADVSRRVNHAGLFVGGGTGARGAGGGSIPNAIDGVLLTGNILDGSGSDGVYLSPNAIRVRGGGNLIRRAKNVALRNDSRDARVEFETQ